MRSNEELLREGECPRPNCIEPAGHTGQCSGDMVRRLPNLLAKIARLEAEAAPLRAAVGVMEPLLQSFGAFCQLDRQGICQSHLRDKPCSVVAARRAFLAALSSDAGKGWVSPEVREQARGELYGAGILSHNRPNQNHNLPFKDCPNQLCAAIRTALDALKGVE